MPTLTEYHEVSTDGINYQFPTKFTCVFANVGLSGTMSDFFAVKTNKFVNLVDTQEVVFDVHGVWLEQSVIKGLFEKTPMFMKDYHEDEEQPYEEDGTC